MHLHPKDPRKSGKQYSTLHPSEKPLSIDPDDLNKTLDLLCRITNATNVEIVCSKLIGYLRVTVDSYFRAELVTRVTELAERYAPDNSWYIETMNETFELGGQFVRPEVAHNLMRMLAEGNDDEEADNDLRAYAVSLYLDLFDKPVLPDVLIHLICWVIGEYSYTAPEYDPQVFLDKLCSLLNRTYEDSGTKGWITTAISKLLAQIGQLPEDVKLALQNQSGLVDVDMIQRCCEIRQLTTDIPLMQKVLPLDSSCEDLEIDPTLSFLDEFVTQALRNGSQPYKPKSQRQPTQIDVAPEPKQPVLKLTPYKTPARRRGNHSQEEPEIEKLNSKQNSRTHRNFEDGNVRTLPSSLQSNEEMHSSVSETGKLSGLSLHTGKMVWGPGGLVKGRRRSGSMDSSKSGSSSKSSEPERIPIKTSAQVTPAPLVMQTEQDFRKQQLAKALFDGVGEVAPLQSNSKRGINVKKCTSKMAAVTKNEEVSSASTKGSKFADVQPKTNLLFNVERNEILNEHGAVGTPQQLLVNHSVQMREADSEGDTPPFQRRDSKMERQAVSILDLVSEEKENKIELSEASCLSLPDDLSQFSHTRELIELCADSNLRITVQKVWKPADLVLVFAFTNQSQNRTIISDISCVIQAPSNLRVSCGSPVDTSIYIELLEPLQSEQHLVSLQYLSPALHMSLSGKVSYKDYTRTTKNLFIDHYTVNMSDLLRPLDMSTEEFEEQWKEAHFEKRMKIDSSNINNGEDLAEKTKSLMNLNPIEIIGMKVIACGTVQQSGVCLLHGQVEQGGSLELRVKSANQLLNDAVMRQCATIFG